MLVPGLSPSSRRAWIEISLVFSWLQSSSVALLAEGVDRNFYITQVTNADWTVALLAEGVDRNIDDFRKANKWRVVALLAEGVDRNCVLSTIFDRTG